MYAFYLPLISDYESSNFPGSNAYFGWVFAAAIPCLTANPSLVSFLLEQRIRKPLFILNDRVVSNFQAHIRCWEGIIIFNIHFVYSLSVPMFLSAERIWLSGKSSNFHMAVIFYSNPFLPLLCNHGQVQSFFSALKALSRKEVHYGAYATSEQVMWTFFVQHTNWQTHALVSHGVLARLCHHLSTHFFLKLIFLS